MNDDLPTISELELEQVMGGKSHTSADLAASSGSGNNNDAILAALQGIQSSLKDLGKNNNGLFGGNNGLLFMTMALALSRRGQMTVQGGTGGYNYSWRGSW